MGKDHRCQAPLCCPRPEKGGQEGSPRLPVHPENGRHEDAADGRHAADGHGRLLHAHDAPAPAILHSRPDPCPAPLATTAGSAKARRYARHGHGRNGYGRWGWTPRTEGWRTQGWAAAAETYEPARTPANGHDGQARHATSAYGWCPAGAPSAEPQVHANCSQPPSPGDAWTNGGSRRSSSTATGSARPGPGAFDRHDACRGPTAGAEADAWGEAVPSHPAHVPRPCGQDHRHAA